MIVQCGRQSKTKVRTGFRKADRLKQQLGIPLILHRLHTWNLTAQELYISPSGFKIAGFILALNFFTRQVSMSFLRKALLVNSSEILVIGLGTLQAILLSRYLGPAGIGQYAVIITAVALTTQFCSCGVPYAMLLYSKQNPSKINTYFMNSFWTGLVLAAFGGIVLVFVVFTITGYFGELPWYALLLIGFQLPFTIFYFLFRNALLIKMEARKLSITRITMLASNCGIVAILCFTGVITIPLAIFARVATLGLVAGICWWFVRNYFDASIKPSAEYSKKILVMGLRQNVADLVKLANIQINIILIKYLIDSFESVGYYSRGQQISNLMLSSSAAVLPLLFSKWAAIAEKDLAPTVEKVMRFITTMGIFIIAVILLSGKWLVLLMYGAKFLPAVEPMMILVPASMLYLFNRTIMLLFGSRGIPEYSVIILVTGTVVTTCVCFAATPYYGIVGAAWSTLLGNLVMLATGLIIIRKKYKVRLRKCWVITRRDLRGIKSALLKRKRN